MLADLEINDRWVRAQRESKNPVQANRPYAFLVEQERSPEGQIEDVATIFLSNNECPFSCLMCDLWKNTTDKPVGTGEIPYQIRWALDRLPQAKVLKLYNSGNFFDIKAIPEQDYPEIAQLTAPFERVVVESHPRLINALTFKFQDLLSAKLEIALGLETVNKDVLPRLNKKMSLEEFETAVRTLCNHQMLTRAFILLKPPFQTETEGIFWAQKSLDFAFDIGVTTCSVIPTRSGNGALEKLNHMGEFSPPKLNSLEQVLDYGIELKAGNVFADLWNLEQFSSCDRCFSKRMQRLQQINLYQRCYPKVDCSCNIN